MAGTTPALPQTSLPSCYRAALEPTEPHRPSGDWLPSEDHTRCRSSVLDPELHGNSCSWRWRIVTSSRSDQPTGEWASGFPHSEIQQYFQSSRSCELRGVSIFGIKKMKGSRGHMAPMARPQEAPKEDSTPPPEHWAWSKGGGPLAARLHRPPSPTRHTGAPPPPRNAPPLALGPAPPPWQPEERFLLSNQCCSHHG